MVRLRQENAWQENCTYHKLGRCIEVYRVEPVE